LDTKAFISLVTRKNNQGRYFNGHIQIQNLKDFIKRTPIANSTESFKLLCFAFEKLSLEEIFEVIQAHSEDPHLTSTLQYLSKLRDENNQTLSDIAEKNSFAVLTQWKRYLRGKH
jgi:hypothetical protein